MVHKIDTKSIHTIRVLAADTVRAGNSGHPGAPMGCAPMAHILFSRFITVNPKNHEWAAHIRSAEGFRLSMRKWPIVLAFFAQARRAPDMCMIFACSIPSDRYLITLPLHSTFKINRDRFVLSNGHGCALHYIMLHLMGYDLTLDDLKHFRHVDSKTPGHPENFHTKGIEVTTGPLGQGVGEAVGLAIAQAHFGATFNKPGYELFSNHTYFILGDGCMQEGVASEAASLAGHLQLGNLIALYDDNHISIDGDTALGFTEDVVKRFEAYGWHTQVLDDGDHDYEGLARAIENAKKVTDKPSLIKIRTTIGYGSLKQGEEVVHGSPLDPADIKQLKTKFGFDSEQHFFVPEEVRDFYAKRIVHGIKAEEQWNALFEAYAQEFPAEAKDIKRRLAGELPEGWQDTLPRYTPSDPAIATRKTSENALTKLAGAIPELLGGSADLTGSNLTRWKGAKDFQHSSTGLGDYSGRYFRYGVREHGMAAIMNGIAAYGGLIPYGATFLNFITYAWGGVRLSALSRLRVIYVMTHDSIGLGEDGPTHQPIETLALTRATPNLLTFRPADGNETSGAYIVAIENIQRPSVIALSRQNLPQLAGSSVEVVRKGAYILQDVADFKVIIVASGSEVSLAVDAAKLLPFPARVVSMPSAELFTEQSVEYRRSIFPSGIPSVSIEAMSTLGWERFSHYQIGMKGWGASGPIKGLMKKFGFVPDAVAQKVEKVVAHFENRPVPDLIWTF
ncbi:transketolase [Jimgerdemannia flammicorona]|uniref:transketolase n=1 Tax=Jimgerdemannia flammicorona TaxID=994334 RepID=A0A433DHF8_9FUNG|nr:transketolase [Jimgerdemannia flammicorona]